MIGRIKNQTMEASQVLVDWMEHRTGIVTITEHFLYEPPNAGPGSTRWEAPCCSP